MAMGFVPDVGENVLAWVDGAWRLCRVQKTVIDAAGLHVEVLPLRAADKRARWVASVSVKPLPRDWDGSVRENMEAAA